MVTLYKITFAKCLYVARFVLKNYNKNKLEILPLICQTEDMKKLHDLTVELQKPSSRLSRTKGLGRCAARFDNEWYRWATFSFPCQHHENTSIN